MLTSPSAKQAYLYLTVPSVRHHQLANVFAFLHKTEDFRHMTNIGDRKRKWRLDNSSLKQSMDMGEYICSNRRLFPHELDEIEGSKRLGAREIPHIHSCMRHNITLSNLDETPKGSQKVNRVLQE